MSWIDQKTATNSAPVTLNAGAAWTDVCEVSFLSGAAKFMLTAAWVATTNITAGEFRFAVNGTPLPEIMPTPLGEAGGMLLSEGQVTTSGTHTITLQCRPGSLILSTLAVGADRARIRAERFT